MVTSWSHTREAFLTECERKYLFQYLPSARRNSSDPILRDIALLKSLRTIPMWKGEQVHAAIARLLAYYEQTGCLPPVDQWVEAAIARVKRQWSFSQTGQYRVEWPSHKSFCALFEHEYSWDLSADVLEAVTRDISLMLRNFAESMLTDEWIQEVQGASRRWIEPPVFGEGATTFRFQDIEVTTKVDLAYVSDQHFEIFDWKTGRDEAESHWPQMETYILWAHLRLGYPLGRVTSRVVNLSAQSSVSHQIDDTGMLIRLRAVEQSARYIREILPPTPYTLDMLPDFQYARHVSVCRHCQFQRVCQRL